MQKINEKVQDMLKRHKIKKQYLFVLFLLSLMVIASVCFSLMSPAMSMSGEITCGKSEHIHVDSCYQRELICKKEFDEHVHSDECYETQAVLDCGYEESEEHTHSEECYIEDQVLICGIPEITEHVHTDECYETELICGEEGHLHNNNCYSIGTMLVADNQINMAAETVADETADTESLDDEDEVELGEDTIDMQNKLQDEFEINEDEYVYTGFDYNSMNDQSGIYANFGNDIIDFKIAGSTLGNILSSSNGPDRRNVEFYLEYGPIDNELLNGGKVTNKIYCNIDGGIDGVLNISDSSPKKGDVLDDDGKKIGEYYIFKDKIGIEFNTSFVNVNNFFYEGKMQFNAYVKKTGNDNGYQIVKIDDKEIKIPFQDINVEKSCEEQSLTVDKQETNVDYTIKISSKNGSGEKGSIEVSDIFTNLNNLQSGSDTFEIKNFKVFKNDDDEPVNVENLPSDGNIESGNNINLTLDALNPGEYYTIKYTIVMTPDRNTIKLNSKNTVTVTDKGYETYGFSDSEVPPEIKKTADSNFSKDVGCSIQKSGNYNEKNNIISWSITVNNPLELSLKNYTVTDAMFTDPNIIADSIKIDNNSIDKIGSLTGNIFTFGVGAKNDKYTITYETKVVDADRGTNGEGKNKINIATLKETNNVEKDASAAVWVYPKRAYLDKTIDYSAGVTYDKGNVIIPWVVDLQYTAGDFVGREYTDTMQMDLGYRYEPNENHYMSDKQIDDIEVLGSIDGINYVKLEKGAEKDYTVNPTYILVPDYQGGGYKKDYNGYDMANTFSLTFSDTSDVVKSLTDVQIRYSTTGKMTGMTNNETRNFKNQSQSDTESAEKVYTATKKILEKFDGRNNQSSNTYYELNDNIKKKNDDGTIFKNENENEVLILKWYIDVNEQCDYQNAIVLEDTLPDGATLVENSVKYRDEEQSLNDRFEVSGQNVTFTIPSSIHNGEKIRVSYDVEIEYNANSPDWWSTDSNGKKFKEFENKVSIKISEWDSIDATQKQIINEPITQTPNEPQTKNIIKSQPSDNTSQRCRDGFIDYTIDVNPNSPPANLNPNGNTITIEDIVSGGEGAYEKKYGGNVDLQVNVELYSLEIVNESTGDTIQISKDKDYIFEKFYDGDYIKREKYKLTIYNLPDNQHLKINYTIHSSYRNNRDSSDIQEVNFTSAEVNTIQTIPGGSALIVCEDIADLGEEIINTVKILESPNDADEKSQHYYLYQVDSASASSLPLIEKVADGNASIKLEGAEFRLYRCDDSDGTWQVLTGVDSRLNGAWGESKEPYELVTGKDGRVKLPRINGAADEGILYKLEEISAPDGYMKSEAPYYFVYDRTSTIKAQQRYSGVSIGGSSNFNWSNVTLLFKGKNLQITNVKMLPATGGVGTRSYIIAGAAIMMSSAAIYFFIKRRARRIK